ncbi:(2Fe-2S)-binding protein [Streptomyces sp. NP160]|uniref:(2Fe-2S)-binding protein n=1 Tax=Streptomyces sp. NP160 TaxID=2586637 RepID=UPI001119DFFC|nr:(2Fe-2S)-binding protein [Streptomyces sp. NP160]TNM63178.1 (2Fe-2S)-binding protein [Streptomyces sp. NP160]
MNPTTAPPTATPTGEDHQVQLRVNGTPHTIRVPAHTALLDALRDSCGLTGSKQCCAVGECGACTVSVDGRTVNSCLVLAVEVDGSDVITAEGLAPSGELNHVQQAFLDHGAVQCGFCIPGMVVSAQAIIERNPDPDIEDIRNGLSGNLCRCAGYNRMFAAVLDAAERTRRQCGTGAGGCSGAAAPAVAAAEAAEQPAHGDLDDDLDKHPSSASRTAAAEGGPVRS